MKAVHGDCTCKWTPSGWLYRNDSHAPVRPYMLGNMLQFVWYNCLAQRSSDRCQGKIESELYNVTCSLDRSGCMPDIIWRLSSRL